MKLFFYVTLVQPSSPGYVSLTLTVAISSDTYKWEHHRNLPQSAIHPQLICRLMCIRAQSYFEAHEPKMSFAFCAFFAKFALFANLRGDV